MIPARHVPLAARGVALVKFLPELGPLCARWTAFTCVHDSGVLSSRHRVGVLRQFFGPSRREVWRQLSEQVDGQYIEAGFTKTDKVVATHGPWTVTLDKYVVSTGKVMVVYTRLRAPYVNPEGFRFTVYRRGVFSAIGKRLGMQDIEVGHEPFDRDFIIKGTSEARLRQLFANPTIRRLIAAQPDVKFEVKDDEGWFGPTFPEGVDELSFMVRGIIKDVDRLKQLFELFAETLDELCRIGSAYETAPDLRL